jgi:5'-AMP-activated protein kinase catalytic alpha subunit
MTKFKGKKSHEGIIVGYNKIPVDYEILKQLTKYGFNDLDYVQTCIEANRHNEATVTYHLAMKKFLKDGGISKYDMGNDDFDKAMIEPVRRKDNTTELLIDNFLTKNSCAGSADITQQHNEKRRLRISREKEKDENKENMGIYMNKKCSKDKGDRKSKSKDKSKDNMKLVLK